MRLNLAHNWIAKILSLLLAAAIWFLIKQHLTTGDGRFENATPARVVLDKDGNPMALVRDDKGKVIGWARVALDKSGNPIFVSPDVSPLAPNPLDLPKPR